MNSQLIQLTPHLQQIVNYIRETLKNKSMNFSPFYYFYLSIILSCIEFMLTERLNNISEINARNVLSTHNKTIILGESMGSGQPLEIFSLFKKILKRFSKPVFLYLYVFIKF